ncbi:MAG: WYL domain-containing protein [Bacteroides sp.]|nr:WYL domain-containing protein [Bacteroides sp.]
MAKDLFNRYIWLVDTIYRTGRITFEEINERWVRTEMSGGKEIPLRTFHNHRQAIEDVFDINIECNKKGGYYYYIENREDMERGGVRNWLLNTFAVNNLINESHKLKNRILFENIPSGQKFLTSIIEAMRDNQVLQITYQSFERSEPSVFNIEPYCVKVFRQRWYVVARAPYYDAIRIYALDRMLALSLAGEEFEYPDTFDSQVYFNSSYGIIVDEEYDVERVRLRVYGNQCKYIRALPLHHTQQEVETTEEYADFEYLLRPTYDFCQEVLSHGSSMEVLKPDWLRQDVQETVEGMMHLYGNEGQK